MKAKKPIFHAKVNENASSIYEATYYRDFLKIDTSQNPYISEYNGYYIVVRTIYNSSMQIINFKVSLREHPTSSNYVPLYIAQSENLVEREEVFVYGTYSENQNLPTTLHQYSITCKAVQTADNGIMVFIFATNTSDWKNYFWRIGLSYDSSNQKIICTDTSECSIQTHSNCIYSTVYNYNIYIGEMYSRYGLFIRYTSSEVWQVCYLTFTSPITITDISGFTLNKSTERLLQGYLNTSNGKYYFVKTTNSSAPTLYSWSDSAGLTNEGSISGITPTNPSASSAGYYYVTNNSIILLSCGYSLYIKKGSTWYTKTLSSVYPKFNYKNIRTTISTTIYFSPQPFGYTLNQEIYLLTERDDYYLAYTFPSSVYSASEEYFFIIESGVVYLFYRIIKESYTPCKCILQKKIFEPDTCYIEDETEPPRAIELYDDNDTLLFWGFSKDGYEFQPTTYKITYQAHWTADLDLKLNTSFSAKKVSEMISTVLSTYCGFLYAGTIDTTTNTYTITEQRTIREFLQWCAYVEQKIITIEPDGKLNFTSGIYNQGNPYAITIQDPKKTYKFTNYCPTKFYVIGGLYNGARLYASQINDPNGEAFVMYATNITSQTELDNILANLITMKSQQRFRMDFINYNDSTLYQIGTIMQFSDSYDTYVDGKTCIVVAVEHEPLYPERTSYIVYNNINYPQQQNQTEERITIIEQNQENHESRLQTVEQGYRFVPLTNSNWTLIANVSGGTTGNAVWNVFTGSSVSSSNISITTDNRSTHLIPSTAKAILAHLYCISVSSVNRDNYSYFLKNNESDLTKAVFCVSFPTVEYYNHVHGIISIDSNGQVKFVINRGAGTVYGALKILGYFI